MPRSPSPSPKLGETADPTSGEGPARTLPREAGPILIRIARAAIAEEFGRRPPAARPTAPTGPLPTPPPAWLAEPGASFVTLTTRGALHGCVGSLTARRPLGDDVAENARSAAFRDHRFPPLGADDFAETSIEVSVLSPPEPFDVVDEAQARARLRPGIDGVVLTFDGRRATFLPQVWDKLPDPADFLAHLKLKAGLPASFWDPEVRLARYTVIEFHEESREEVPEDVGR